jgi:hypothetical protein
MPEPRTPLSSLIGQKIMGFIQTHNGYAAVNGRGDTIFTINAADFTLFDKDGNYFEDDDPR